MSAMNWITKTATGGGGAGGGAAPDPVETALGNFLMGDYKLGSNPDNADGRAELVALDYAAATSLR
jgi:hypothetical protein